MDILTVYYSRTGNTKKVAEQISENLGTDIERIIDKKDRTGKIGYLKSGGASLFGRKTEIEEPEKNPENYDLIIIGTPLWAWRLPPAVRTYLEKYDISDKKVSFFNTNDSTESQNNFSLMEKLSENSKPISKLVVSKVSKEEKKALEKTNEWCEELEQKIQDL